MHFRADIPKREGIYHVRLYDVFNFQPNPDEWLTMEQHAVALFPDSQPDYVGSIPKPNGVAEDVTVVPGDLTYEENFGDMQSAHDNELLQGAIQHENFKISLEADPVFRTLIASVRNFDMDIWIEITLEQWALKQRDTNLPPQTEESTFWGYTPLQHVQPRKERSVFWGKLVRNEVAGYADYQKYKEGLLRDTKVSVHIGGLDLNFIHWLHVRLAMPGESLLLGWLESDLGLLHAPDVNGFLQPVGMGGGLLESMAKLMAGIVTRCSPTILVSTVDHHLVEDYLDTRINAQHAVDDCSFQMPVKIEGDHPANTAEYLDEVFVNVVDITSHKFTSLFNFDTSKKKNHGPWSLFTRWPTAGDALTTLLREFFFRNDVEIPTLQEANEVPLPIQNNRDNRTAYWAGTTRWLFCGIDELTLEATIDPIEKSVKYNPASVWIKSIKVEEPQANDVIYSMFSPATWDNFITEGKDISYETLFDFCGKKLSGADDARGPELIINAAGYIGFEFARKAYPGSNGVLTDWANTHVAMQIQIWGGVRALVEFDSKRVGITPFGSGINDFGFNDYGDFRTLRFFKGSPGLLYDDSLAGEFSIIDIKSTPGGDTHIRGIERMTFDPGIIDPPPPGLPPPPDPPQIHFPPPFSGSPVCDTINFIFGIEYPSGCVSRADIKVDGNLYGSVNTFPNPMPTGIIPVGISIAVCNLGNGGHVIEVDVTLCDGSVISQVWNFTVQCPCVGHSKYIFSY